MRQISGKEKRKKSAQKFTVAAYFCGLLILAAAFLCAFWLPEYYSQWQDEKLLGQVRLEDRRNAGLPEEKDHTVAETIRAIQEGGGFERIAVYDREGSGSQNAADKEEGGEEITAEEAEKVFSQLIACAEEWQRFGLLPQSVMDLCSMAAELEELVLYETLETRVGIYWIQLKAGGNTLDFLMEQEGVCLLYSSVTSETPGQETDWFAQEESIDKEMADGGSFHIREYCQAEYAFLEETNDHYGMIRLLYGDFESIARREQMFAYYYEYSGQVRETRKVKSGFYLVLDNSRLEEIIIRENMENGVWYEWG